MMQHYQHNKRTQIFLLCCFTSLLQFQIFKEQHSEERLVNARCEQSDKSLKYGIPEIGLGNWWSQAGSNRRPPACKAGALPAELWPL